MVPVTAPRFDLSECNNETERMFIEALQARASAGGWYADSWPRPDGVIVSVCRIQGGAVVRTLRVDFDGVAMMFGDDETHQFVTDLDPAREASLIPLFVAHLEDADESLRHWAEVGMRNLDTKEARTALFAAGRRE